MQPVIYDVAVSADGFISGASGDVSLFPHDGSIVDDYVARLQSYSCCLMGRRTYEFGYAFGLTPGANPYPHMRSVVFSRSLELPVDSNVELVSDHVLETITQLRESSSGPIYLCGGGDLAGWLLERNAIQKLRLKRAPIFLGSGIRLFGQHVTNISVTHLSTMQHGHGIIFQEFDVNVP